MLTKEQQRTWVAALRSGEYEQGTQRLVTSDEDPTKYCCLGVFGEVCLGLTVGQMGISSLLYPDVVPDIWDIFGDYSLIMPCEVPELAPRRKDSQSIFAHANDALKLNFRQIAHLVEHLPTKD